LHATERTKEEGRTSTSGLGSTMRPLKALRAWPWVSKRVRRWSQCWLSSGHF